MSLPLFAIFLPIHWNICLASHTVFMILYHYANIIHISQAEEEFTNLLGVDYSSQAIELARAVAVKMDLNIKYEVCYKFY
jgi:hypothetical protein